MTGQCKSKRFQAGKQLHVLMQTLFLGLSKSLTWKKATDEWALSVNGVRRTELSCRTVPVVLKHTLWHLNNDTHIKAQSIFTSISSPPVKKERIAFERLLLVWSTQTRNEILREKKRTFHKVLMKMCVKNLNLTYRISTIFNEHKDSLVRLNLNFVRTWSVLIILIRLAQNYLHVLQIWNWSHAMYCTTQ